MAKIVAEGFSDYHDQSLQESENAQFVEDVESAILEHIPSKGTVDIEYETEYVGYDKANGTVDRLFKWSGELEYSELKIYGTIKVRAKFLPRGTNPALLEFVHAWDYEDDMSK